MGNQEKAKTRKAGRSESGGVGEVLAKLESLGDISKND